MILRQRPALKPETASEIRRIIPAATTGLLADLGESLYWAPAVAKFAQLGPIPNQAVVALDRRRLAQLALQMDRTERAMAALAPITQYSISATLQDPALCEAQWQALRSAVRAVREQLEAIPIRQGRPPGGARLFADGVAVVLRRHGVRVTSGETSVFARILEVLLDAAGIFGDVDLHELTKDIVRQARGGKSS
jgi:hypothetical protein